MARLNEEGKATLARLEQAEASGRKLNPQGQALMTRLRQARDSESPTEGGELSFKNVLAAAPMAAKIAGQEFLKEMPLTKAAKFIANNPGSAGATAMTLAAGPVGIPAAVGLAALGGGGGVAIKQLIDRARGAKAPATPLEAATEIGKEGAVQGAIEGVARGAGKLAEKAVYPAGKKALGFVKRFMKSPSERKAADLAVKELGDDVIKPLGSPQAMLEKVGEISDKAGERIGQFLKESGVGFDANEAVKRLDALRPRTAAGTILNGGEYAAENKIIDNAIETIKAHGPQGMVDAYGQALPMEPMAFEEMNLVKGKFQGLANYSKTAKTPTEILDKKIAATFTNYLDESLDKAAEAAGKLKGYGEFLKDKKTYQAAQSAKRALNDRVSKSGNQLLSLGDKIVGGVGVGAVLLDDDKLGTGGKALAALALNHIGANYGAQAAYNVARAIQRNPALLPGIARALNIGYREATDGK